MIRPKMSVQEIETALDALPFMPEGPKRMKATDHPAPMSNLKELFQSWMGDQKCIVPSCPNRVQAPVKCPSCHAAAEAANARESRLARLVDSKVPQVEVAPEKFDWATFANVEASVPNKRAFARVKGLAPDIRSAVLCGNDSGIAKTLLSMAWFSTAIRAGASGFWLSALDVVRAAREKGEFAALLDRVAREPILVLDDWGMELAGALPNSGVASQRVPFMMEVIEERSKRRMPMWVTTAKSEKDLQVYYGVPFVRRVFERPEMLGTVIDMGAA